MLSSVLRSKRVDESSGITKGERAFWFSSTKEEKINLQNVTKYAN